jgi:Zn-dependent metalloprotease
MKNLKTGILLIILAIGLLSSCNKNLFKVSVDKITSNSDHLVSDQILQEMGYLVDIIESSGEFQIYNYSTDQYGSYARCNQYYHGFPIFLGDVNFIFIDGADIVGDVVDTINVSTIPKIEYQKAAEIADQLINSKKSYTAELGFFDINGGTGINVQEYKLCWRIAVENGEYLYAIIDAQTGVVLKYDDGIMS